MTEKEKEQLADELLYKMFKDEPVKVLQAMLVIMGKECVACNAETMKINQESDIGEQRYKIACNIKITKVKSLKKQPDVQGSDTTMFNQGTKAK